VSENDFVAAIDIGTNSVHLLVARVMPNRRLELVASEKEVVRLGSGATDMKVLADDAMDRGIAALKRFRQLAEVWEAPIHAVATSAVREAENKEVFLQRARTEAGIDIEVISGVEEARLIHLGVIQSLAVMDKRLLVVDIGGGSTEVLVGLGGRTLTARSHKLGAIRLTERFFTNGSQLGEKVSPKRIERARKHIRSFLAETVADVKTTGFEMAIGSSGTIENIALMVQRLHADRPPLALNGFTFTRAELEKVVGLLTTAPDEKARAQIPGIDPRRVDIIVAGAVLLEAIFATFDIESMTVSEYALREGVLFDQLREYHGDSLHHLNDLRRSSVLHVAEMFDPDRAHSEQVTELALALFHQTKNYHGLGDRYIDYLEASGLLHNVGRVVAHDAHHRHSYYVIRHTDQLTGFTDHEIELIALIARYHRKSAPKDKHPDFAVLGSEDQQTVRILAGILRIAIGLDRTRQGLVDGIRTSSDGDTLHIRAVVASDVEAELEIYSAQERSDLFESSIGMTVEISSVTE